MKKQCCQRDGPEAVGAGPTSGFTLIELLVVIVIITLLAALLFPVFVRVRENARRAACLSNLKQIGTAITQYTQDSDETLPPSLDGDGNTWRGLTYPYTKDTQVYACPSNPLNHYNTANDGVPLFPVSYGSNATVLLESGGTLSLSKVQNPSRIFLVGESNGGSWKLNNPPNPPTLMPGCGLCFLMEGGSHTDLFAGHQGHSNWLFEDGHVQALRPSETCKGADAWDLARNNADQPCSLTLAAYLQDNEEYWNLSNTP